MKNQELSTNKIPCISYMRIISMLLIIIFHSLCFYIGTWWFLHAEIVSTWKFVAPPIVKTGLIMFVFIAGFLYGYLYIRKEKYKNSTSFLTNKTRHLLLPYFIWGCFMIIAFPQLKYSWINLLTGIAHLWFLLMIYLLFIIIVFLERFIRISKTPLLIDIIFTLLSFLLFYIWKNYSTHHHFLCMEETLYYLPAFIIGFYSAKYIHIEKAYKIRKTAIIAIIFLSLCLFTASYYQYPTSSTIYRIPTILISINMLFIFPKTSKSSKYETILKSLDNNSMGIYIFNQIVVFFLLFHDYQFFIHHLYSGPFIIFAISLFIPWGISAIFNYTKYLSWINGR